MTSADDEIENYRYHLPENAIALTPPAVRGQAKLLVLDVESGALNDRQYADVADYLRPGDLVILNETAVEPARLHARKAGSDKAIELVVLEQHHLEAPRLQQTQALYRGKLRAGAELILERTGQPDVQVLVKATQQGIADLEIVNSALTFQDILAEQGSIPLPPYMQRAATAEDRQRYQTEFAKHAGSVAAPTASLNFTAGLIAQLQERGVEFAKLTLHVGLGTFLPVRVEKLSEHKMHSEFFYISAATVAQIQQARREGRRVVAVGTTVARTLEFVASRLDSAQGALSGEADIFIHPGYQFQAVDCLLTNFHAPDSTVLLLAAAFAGWPALKHAYEHALAHDYKFLSYGDSMFLLHNR